ncbi:unnamed protein product [Miscanthus lutarioriparius]|uniref:starch synthase n=1 Tax=Miscanthus lutarioriparius TaxID=422564 RepID=A0A811Q174_9POAL|nr:unnamed protein product [Miscanthus lutarioriparius]
METPRLVVAAASRAPPPTPRFRRRRLPRPRGGAHCFPFARATRPVLLSRCSYSSREGNGDSRGKPRRESSSTVRLDVDADSDQVPSLADEGDVGELFRLAQRNILYINKQRLMAMEELKKLQDENNLLLEEIQVLETEMQGIPLEAAQSSSFSELLLRIDTMVISGMISMAEASDLREKVVTNRSIIQSAFSDIHHKPNTELLSELRLFLHKPIEKPLHIVHICSEMYPISSCGSLSTYVASLSCEIHKKGNLVEVILPKYTSINVDGIHGLRRAEAEYESYFGGLWHKNKIWTGTSSGVGLVLIEPSQLSYFSRDMLHGYPDDFERFSYFSRASLDYIVKSEKRPDIIHIHNWETAIVAPLFWDIFAHQGLGNTRILLTCQDLNSECLEEPNKLEMCGLDPHKLHRHDRLQDTNKTDLVNILKVGCICDDNSDIHSLKEAVHVALRRNTQVIIMEKLGSIVNSTLRALKGEIMGDKIAFVEAYDEALAHLIYAGSDIILCSSFQDPSLQTAMKAIKYGSVPVQINFPSDESRELEGHDCPNTAMSQYIISTYGDLSLSQAFDDFNNDPSHWDRQIKDGMARGSSWDVKCYNLHWEAYSSIRKL